jgi:hypothetical protein
MKQYQTPSLNDKLYLHFKVRLGRLLILHANRQSNRNRTTCSLVLPGSRRLSLVLQGWKSIEPCIGEYTGVKALWLEGNGLQGCAVHAFHAPCRATETPKRTHNRRYDALYFTSCLCFWSSLASEKQPKEICALPPVFFAMHIARIFIVRRITFTRATRRRSTGQ